eukprot:TRINITY_DN19217_c0_g1_i1.p1 TRINITY_DN19217_c0_g1~~TRINITY_DN19217_c0_g1_i1.p1  ORF type:complete len:566 (+),score=79.44 TRINITY_DN19217_c0_g1_i1:43-1740(+)
MPAANGPVQHHSEALDKAKVNGVLYGFHGCEKLQEMRGPCLDIPKQPSDHIRLICVSDTHEHEEELDIPGGDILIHCGDVLQCSLKQTKEAALQRFREFAKWFAGQKPKHKILICGNHDNQVADLGEVEIQKILSAEGDNIHYLEYGSVTLFGINFFGLPTSFGRSANNCFQRLVPGDEYTKIPKNTDIVITHGPCVAVGSNCDAFFVKEFHSALQQTSTNLVVSGHLHWASGMSFLNNGIDTKGEKIVCLPSAVMNMSFELAQQPTVYDYKLPSTAVSRVACPVSPVVVFYCFDITDNEIKQNLLQTLGKHYSLIECGSEIEFNEIEDHLIIGFITSIVDEGVISILGKLPKRTLSALYNNEIAVAGDRSKFHGMGFNVVTGFAGYQDIARIVCLSEALVSDESVEVVSYERTTTVEHKVVSSRVRRTVLIACDCDVDTPLRQTCGFLVKSLRQSWSIFVATTPAEAASMSSELSFLDACVVLSYSCCSVLSRVSSTSKRITFGFKKNGGLPSTHIASRSQIHEVLRLLEVGSQEYADHVAVAPVLNPLDFSVFRTIKRWGIDY